MNILLVPVGSAGDVHPFLGLGCTLRARGHRVTVITNSHFESQVRRAGLEFVAVGTAETYREITQDPDLWHPRKGFYVFAQRVVAPMVRPVYERIAERFIPGDTVVAAAGFAFGARIAHDKLKVPLVTVFLQPEMLRSVYDSPKISGVPMLSLMPRWGKRLLFNAIDRFVADPLLTPPVNGLRKELGLPPVHRILDRWWYSPQRIIGFFPKWFGAQQPDWPAHTALVGFPLYDDAEAETVDGDIAAFLAVNPPPIVFTPGSAMRHGKNFFKVSVEACSRLGCRGLLLTTDSRQIPDPLPTTVKYAAYLPFSQVLPRATAIVHHGGIGTSAQALAAGIPQLIVPFSHDQPDNASRLVHLNVAAQISPRAYRPARVAGTLGKLICSQKIKNACGSYLELLKKNNACNDAASIIETMT